MDKEKELPIVYMDDRPADVPRLWVNSSKFKKLTGFDKLMPFEEGLKITIDYYVQLMRNKNLISEIKIKNWE